MNSWPTIGISVLATSLLIGCGGGGGGGTASGSPTGAAISYKAVVTEGELVTFTVNTRALTYSYTIDQSAYGKTGATASGQLVANSDGSYAPSGISGGKIVVLESGLLKGYIKEDLNNDGVDETLPAMGISNPITSLADAVGTYNFISRQCGNTNCVNFYGTVTVNQDGSWHSCVGANLAANNPVCQSSANGTVSSFTSGHGSITVNGNVGGTMLIFKDPNTSQKVIMIDLNGGSNLGKGAIFGASQNLPASANGTWSYTHTNKTEGKVVVTGTSFTDSGVNGLGQAYGPINGTLSFNQPWSGFVTTSNGAVLLPAGSGFYAGYFGSNSSMSVGIRSAN